jgi:hypothetical protein
MNIPSFQESLFWLHHNCEYYNVFTKKGKLRSRFSVYIALIKTVGIFGPVGTSDIKIMAGTGRDMDKIGTTINENTTLLGIYNFKDKKEIDKLTEEKYNEIVYELQRQYKEYYVNESLQKIQQDFD